MYNFKTSNNFSPKIYYENVVDIKNKIIISNWDLPQLGIKKIAKMLWHFVVLAYISNKIKNVSLDPKNEGVGSQIVAQTQVEKGDGPNKPSTINL